MTREQLLKIIEKVKANGRQMLYLSGNQLTTLDGVTFPESLQMLYLSRNQLTETPAELIKRTKSGLYISGVKLPKVSAK